MKSTYIIIFLSLVTLSLNTSCKKKDKKPSDTPTPSTPACDTTFIDNYINDTIFPSEYLMTYPGSEWNYDNGTTVVCDQWENIPIAATTTSGECVTVTKNFHFLPHCTSAPFYVAYDREVSISNPYVTKLTPILDTAVGMFYQNNYSYVGWQSPYAVTTVYETFAVVEKLDSLEVLSVTYPEVIHVRKHIQATGYNEGSATYHYYYAKNVGLIKSFTGEYTYIQNEKNLTSYTIGPH